MPPAVEAQSLNHWTTREVPRGLPFECPLEGANLRDPDGQVSPGTGGAGEALSPPLLLALLFLPLPFPSDLRLLCE